MNHQELTRIEPRTIHPQTDVGLVALKVANLQRSIDFYTQMIGLRLLEQPDATTAVMGVDTSVVSLHEIADAVQNSGRFTGMYHAAILLPDRVSLARTIWHLYEAQVQFGYADHLVSEAFYISDPDNNGLELYRDRPRSEWQWQNNQVQMDNAPIDFDSLFGEMQGDTNWNGMPTGTKLGHMHLQVGDMEKTFAFYVDLLGFDLVARMPSALFISAGGYHHHLGLNTWHSRNAPPAPANMTGLLYYTINVPAEELTALADRLTTAGVTFTQDEQKLVVKDPWQNTIHLTVK